MDGWMDGWMYVCMFGYAHVRVEADSRATPRKPDHHVTYVLIHSITHPTRPHPIPSYPITPYHTIPSHPTTSCHTNHHHTIPLPSPSPSASPYHHHLHHHLHPITCHLHHMPSPHHTIPYHTIPYMLCAYMCRPHWPHHHNTQTCAGVWWCVCDGVMVWDGVWWYAKVCLQCAMCWWCVSPS